MEFVDVGGLVMKIERWCGNDYYICLGDLFGPATIVKTGESIFKAALKSGPLIKGRIDREAEGIYFKEGQKDMAILFSPSPALFEKGTRGWAIEGYRYGNRGLYYFIYIKSQRDDGLWEKRDKIAISSEGRRWTLRYKEDRWEIIDFVDYETEYEELKEPEDVYYPETPSSSIVPYLSII
jgi:hypothetical protein